MSNEFGFKSYATMTNEPSEPSMYGQAAMVIGLAIIGAVFLALIGEAIHAVYSLIALAV